MPSALYRPLEQSLKDYNEDYPNQQHQHYQPYVGACAPFAHSAAVPASATSMSSRISRSTRRCLVLSFVCLIFIYIFWCSVTAIAGGGNGGDDDGIDADEHGPDSTNSQMLNETLIVCSEVNTDTRLYIQNKPNSAYSELPVIYFVTPTYPRREQIAEITRLAHTLLHVPRLHWIVANDHATCNVFLNNLLIKFGLPFTHLASPMPNKYRTLKPAPRGVSNRRAAMQWLRQQNISTGVLYFGDDDNTYDLKLFSDIRDTQRVSMFPVALIEQYSISGPVVRQGKVVGFLDSWVASRRWPIDMAGFSVNIAYMSLYPNARMPYKPGYEEDLFLRSIHLKLDFIEPKGNNCTEILVWHTQTKNKKKAILRIDSEYLDDRSNLGALFKTLDTMGVSKASDDEGPRALISINGKVKPHFHFLS